MASKWLDVVGGLKPATASARGEREQWWDYTRTAALGLRQGKSPACGPGLWSGAQTAGSRVFPASANYARLYGGDGSYTTTGLLVLGSPGFMIGAFAASGMTPMVWCGR